MSENNLDTVLATVIQNPVYVSDPRLEQYFDKTFLRDLTDLFANKSSDIQSWYSFAMSLKQSEFFQSEVAALEKIAPLISDPAKIYLKVAEKRRRLGQFKEAAISFGNSYRFAPDLKLAKTQFDNLRGYLKLKVPPPWEIVSAFIDPKRYSEINTMERFPELMRDMTRNQSAKDQFFHFFSKVDLTGGIPADCSFVVLKGNKAMGLVESDILGHRPLSCRESAIIVNVNEQLDESEKTDLLEIIFQSLLDTAKFVGAREILIEEKALPVLTPVSLFARKRQNICFRVERALIDLSKTEEEIRKEIRSRYKTYINNEKKEFKLRWWSNGNTKLIKSFFSLYKMNDRIPIFHSPEDLLDLLKKEKVDLLVANDETGPISVTLISYDGEGAYYTASASKEEPLKKGLHWPLFASIIRAKQRGYKKFDLGYLFPEGGVIFGNQENIQKMKSISFFKRGFVKDFISRNWFVVKI